MKSFGRIGRTTPFILLLSVRPPALAAEMTGQWLFASDGTGIEIHACSADSTALCATITTLPRDAAELSGDQRAVLCGSLLMGDLRRAAAKASEKRLRGWIVDPAARLHSGSPPRHEVGVLQMSDGRVRIEVHGPLGVVVERYPLERPAAPIVNCR